MGGSLKQVREVLAAVTFGDGVEDNEDTVILKHAAGRNKYPTLPAPIVELLDNLIRAAHG